MSMVFFLVIGYITANLDRTKYAVLTYIMTCCDSPESTSNILINTLKSIMLEIIIVHIE